MDADTIFALSSGSGASGVAIVRISGPRAVLAAEMLVGAIPAPRCAALRTVRDPRSGEVIDSGVILFFRGPASFTGEDLVEIQVHGSLAVLRELLAILGRIPGLRAADAGEFSARAFYNGKMDLIQIEALGDLLAAETMAQATLARRYQSSLRKAAARWRETLVGLIALTEAYIDFSDEGDVQASEGDVQASLEIEIENDLEALGAEIASALTGMALSERMRRGFRIAILGPPNAGKSSLLNALASRDVAITSPIAGTTRDAIEVHLDLKGVPVTLIDTAGIRDTRDSLEKAGIARAMSVADDSDMILWLSPPDHAVDCPFPNAAVVYSKSDLFDSHPNRTSDHIRISVRDSVSISKLIEFLHARASQALVVGAENVMIANQRQAGALQCTLDALARCRHLPAGQLELRAEELRGAAKGLDILTGRIRYDEILGSIFSRFCIGK